MSADTDEFDTERVRRYAENNPNVTPMDVLGQLRISPAYREHVAAIVAGEEPPTETVGDETDEELTTAAIREHYRHARPVYEALGDVCGNETLAIADHVGWYTKRDTHNLSAADEWPKQGRCLTFSRDFEEFIGRIERVAYATALSSPCVGRPQSRATPARTTAGSRGCPGARRSDRASPYHIFRQTTI